MAPKREGAAKGRAKSAAKGAAKSAAKSAAKRGARGAARDGASPRGALVIVGGHEDKEGDRLILRLLARRAGAGRLVVATVASAVPGELWATYGPLFRQLGVRDVVHLDVASREDAKAEERVRLLDGATAVFFTGGDQLKITSQLGDSPIYARIRDLYLGGATIAGTSAGASVMAETMLVAGAGDESSRIGGGVQMAPGFGLLPGAIIDQHFAQRGRIGRLLAAVTQNPRILGIGIDEDTAILCEPGHRFTVLGAGAVSVVDGADISYTNLTEEERDRTLSVFDARLHVLSMGDVFDMTTRRPRNFPAEEVEAAIVGPSEGEGRDDRDPPGDARGGAGGRTHGTGARRAGTRRASRP